MISPLKNVRAVALTLVVAGAAGIVACDTVKTNLLDAPNPTIIDPSAVQSIAGATAVRNGALSRLRTATADGESSWMFGGLLADEWATSSTFVQNDETDQRSIQLNNSTVTNELRALYRVRTDANQAIALLNKYKPAPAALVTGIATSFRYDVTASLTGGFNTLWDQAASQNRYTVSDSVQGNGRTILVKNAIPFLSAKDPRVPAHYKIASNGRDSVKSQDGGTFVIQVDSLWGQTSPVSLTAGLDARLIEAEAALQAGNPAGVLTNLNALRAAPVLLTPSSPTATGTHPGWTTPVMAPLADPGTAAGRVKLLFREQAFWQFGRGHRLGELPRLLRGYGPRADGSDTFPVGPHFKGGVFGADLNLPVTTDEQVGNSKFTSCIDRKALRPASVAAGEGTSKEVPSSYVTQRPRS